MNDLSDALTVAGCALVAFGLLLIAGLLLGVRVW